MQQKPSRALHPTASFADKKWATKSFFNAVRDPAEVEAGRERDAIKLLEAVGVARGLVTEAEFAATWADTEAEIFEAIEFARNSPDPDPADILDDVYSV
mgnify:CR=1 FL=1